eukprot:15364944-Ditylum_brightwellii.AAC.5
MSFLHLGYCKGAQNLCRSKQQEEEGETVIGQMKIKRESICHNIASTQNALTVPNSPVRHDRAHNELYNCQVFWVGVLVEAGLVEPSGDTGAVHEVHVTAVIGSLCQNSVEGDGTSQELKSIEGKYSYKLSRRHRAFLMWLKKTRTFGMMKPT